MSHPYSHFLRAPVLTGLLLTGSLVTPVAAQTPKADPPSAPAHSNSVKAQAYYHFALGHLYEDLAATYGNRSEYANKAIDNYRLAIKEDPSASFLVENIAELYRMSGRIREAVEEAQAALKSNPHDINARRVLAHIYTQEIGDPQTNHVDEGMARRAIEQYKTVVQQDPKDIESLVMLGRLDRLVGDSVGAQSAYKQALTVEPENEDAVTGLASVFAERNDPKSAAELLQQLTAKTPSARSLVSLASYYEQMKQYALAADAYTKAIQLDPGRAELKGALAQDQALAGRLDDAIRTFQELAESNPQEPLPYLGMAQIYRQQKDFSKAQQMVDKARELEPDNLDIRLEETRLLEAEGKTSDAISMLKGVIDAANKRGGTASQQPRAELLDSLGALYRVDQQYDRAVEAFRQAAALNSEISTREEIQIIETYRAAHDYTKANAEIDAALHKSPNDRTLQEVHAEVLSDTAKYPEAIATLKKLMDGSHDREVDLALADTYEKAKDFEGMASALDAADKLSTTKEEKAEIVFRRGSLYERQKKFDLAEKQFRAALDADPNNASALNYLGYMFADQGIRLQEAQDLITKAINLEPNNYAFLDSLGWVYYHQNRLPEAEQELRHSLEMVANDPTIHDHLGDVLFKEGKLKEAIDQWQSSMNAFHTTPQSEIEPDEVAKVQKKLDTARVRLAKEQAPARNR